MLANKLQGLGLQPNSFSWILKTLSDPKEITKALSYYYLGIPCYIAIDPALKSFNYYDGGALRAHIYNQAYNPLIIIYLKVLLHPLMENIGENKRKIFTPWLELVHEQYNPTGIPLIKLINIILNKEYSEVTFKEVNGKLEIKGLKNLGKKISEHIAQKKLFLKPWKLFV